MKISVDGVELFTLTEAQKKVFQYSMRKEAYERELKGMIVHDLEHKFHCCFGRLKEGWEQKLIDSGLKNLPLNKEKFAEEVFKHADYKDRSARNSMKKSEEVL